MISGINNPFGGKNYVTTDYYLFAKEAKAKLALGKMPQLGINLFVYKYKDDLHGPTEVAGNNNGNGTGQEYWTEQPIPFWSRAPVIWPLF
jgi:hypothetical protein